MLNEKKEKPQWYPSYPKTCNQKEPSKPFIPEEPSEPDKKPYIIPAKETPKKEPYIIPTKKAPPVKKNEGVEE